MSQYELEQALIIKAARSQLSDFDAGTIPRLPGAGLQWDYILNTTGKHGIAPLLHSMLARNGLAEEIPGAAAEALRNNYLASLMRNKLLYQGLARIHSSFSDFGIEMILLKGGALGVNIYDDFGLRPFSDIDILVHKKDVPRCRELMEALDFKVVPGAYGTIPDERNDELGCEWTYVNEAVVIELHWNLMTHLSPFVLDPELYWEDAEPVVFEESEALAMGPEDQLIHLCLHQFKHHWEHLRDLADVALLIDRRGDDIDWRKVADRAARQKAERCVYHTLSLSARVLDAAVPPDAFSHIEFHYRPGATARALEDLIADNIFRDNMPRRFWELILVDGMRRKAGIVREVLARPFPRRGEQEQFGKQKAHSFGGRVAAAFKSLMYYRRMAASYLRHLLRRARR